MNPETNLAEILVQLLAGCSAATIIACWYGPYVCRLIAALLLAHAVTVERSRKIRKKEMDRRMKAFGISRHIQRPAPDTDGDTDDGGRGRGVSRECRGEA
jgi:hypothetical protein